MSLINVAKDEKVRLFDPFTSRDGSACGAMAVTLWRCDRRHRALACATYPCRHKGTDVDDHREGAGHSPRLATQVASRAGAIDRDNPAMWPRHRPLHAYLCRHKGTELNNRPARQAGRLLHHAIRLARWRSFLRNRCHHARRVIVRLARQGYLCRHKGTEVDDRPAQPA